jgi:hypothetical protein
MSMNDELSELYRVVASGAVSLKQALEEARTLPLDSDFDESGIHPLAINAIEAARARSIQSACVQWRIVLEALDHARTPRQTRAVSSAASIAGLILLEIADGRILADASPRGNHLAATLLREESRGALVYGAQPT